TLGALVLAAMLVYLLASARRRLSIRTSTWALQLPSASTALAQGTLATLDLLLVGTLIYVLLPGHGGTSFIDFLGVFALAMMAGGASNVPGGLGVFETVLLLGLPEVAPAALLGSILLFRCAYYLSPLALAAILLATHEVLSQRPRIARLHGVATDWLAEIGPQVMGMLLIFAGVLLLFSGSVPADPPRLAWMIHTLPLWVIEVFHLLGAALGLALIILARGLSRRLNVAYRLSAIGLVLGIVGTLLSELNAEVAALLALVLLVLLPTYREFPRRASLWSQGFTVEWLSTITAILAMTVWMGFFTHKHITYSHELLWSFSYTGEYARFLRSSTLAFVLTGAVTLVNLVRPYPRIERAGAEALERVRRIVRREPETRAQLALLGDKRILFSESGNAFIMYQVQGKSWVSLGDPLGPVAERQRLLWSYRDLCDRYGGWPVFYLVDAASLSLYVDLGLSLVKIGDEARVKLDELSILNVASARLREVHRAVRAAGVGFEIAPSREVPALLPELRAVSDAWLHRTGQAEQGFSRGYFDTDYVSHLPCALVRYRERIIAFAVLWASRNKEELGLDLMRYGPEAPAGVIDYLLVESMLGGKARGYRWFSLGIAPLSEIESHPLAPLWHRVGKLMYRQSEHFPSIEGLRRYEEGFRPVWRPKYLASPGGYNLPRILRDIARLTARGRPEAG
ncbi:MAG: bifunctional lysylphosphatidylglycerol flippase/synthetase MprF, partial [Gammaproteobacteria bacterium]